MVKNLKKFVCRMFNTFSLVYIEVYVLGKIFTGALPTVLTDKLCLDVSALFCCF